MKISLEWLNDYIPITESAQDLAEMLNNIGFEVESIEKTASGDVIDLEVTSNRGDCLGFIGIAREIAAATGGELTLPKLNGETVKADISKMVSVKIAAPELCSRYTARIIRGVKVAPSPDWLKNRLEALGQRSVNNVVDATNYAMLETGQPPHAFDLAKIADGKIIVRKAKKGESITAIDSTNCKLDENMLIIADTSGAIAIAGVMGGLETEVSDSTVDILLEDAGFDPVSVRTTARTFAINSEAAYRFERIVDTENIDWASQRTAELIVKAAGGEIVEGVVDCYPKKQKPKTAQVRLSRVSKLLGIDIPKETAMKILAGLCFEPKDDGDVITCSVPSWRADIYREADLIEEIGRMYGYDKIGTRDKINIKVVGKNKRVRLCNDIASAISGMGFYETINVTFTNEKTAKLITGQNSKNLLAVKDVTRKSDNVLRNSLLGSLMEVLKGNYNSGNRNIRIYEIANVFSKNDDGNRGESTKLSLLCDCDFQILRAAIEKTIRAACRKAAIEIAPAKKLWAKAGADIIVDGRTIGDAGVVSDKIVSAFGIKDAQVCAAEIDFDALLAMDNEVIKTAPLAKFPAIERVLSLIVDEQVQWSQIAEAINSNAPAELEQTNFEGIYRGKPIEPGKKSVTVSMLFRDADGTLKHETVDGWENQIVEQLKQKTSAQLRST
ncbi:MAG: phenylalanine--tRNA ligase subunit beta [Anaerohalosphaeraceae bacterium]|nr:phenylalanine--tRNA ligase subunit beta [Anaerohalosphaeraceae bacterium]